MKLKKFAAVAMAAVMSVAMFTACSSGGGSKTTPNGTAFTEEYELVERFVPNKVTGEGEYTKIIKDGPGYYRDYTTSNGTWTYYQYIYVNYVGEKEIDEELNGLEGGKFVSYIVNTETEPWKAYKNPPEIPDPDEGDSGEGNTQKPSSNVTEVPGTEKYNGVEYDTVTKTTIHRKDTAYESTQIVTEYYVKGTNTLAYKKTETQREGQTQSGRVEKVRLTNTVDPESANKLNIGKYTIVENEEDLGR